MKIACRTVLCAALSLLPLSAFAYTIDVDKDLNGTDVSFETRDIDADIGGITLSNFGATAAVCAVVFRNGPEAPKTRKVVVAAGKTADLSMRFTRDIIRLQLTLTCKPQ